MSVIYLAFAAVGIIGGAVVGSDPMFICGLIFLVLTKLEHIDKGR